MVVQHNLSAMNANRMLGINQKTLASSTEKLSSGYAINRAADNAAGLSISEKMRKQIRGLNQASANAEDGISTVQTAEGALAEVTDMLQRMNELAVQSANGTNSENDRNYIQDEIDQLVTEIDRVSSTTKFNETYLLKGDKDAEQLYSYSYRKWKDNEAATAQFKEDAATSLHVSSVTFEKDNGGTVSEQNDLARILRDQGVTVSYTKALNTTGNTFEDHYTLSLNGTAGDTFKVVTKNATTGTFEIQNAAGTKIADITAAYKAGVTNKVVGDTAISTAWTVSAAKKNDEISSYYDKDGNAISANALEKYVAIKAADSKLSVKAESPQVYDALGKKTTVDIGDGSGSGAAGGTIAFQKDQTAALKLSFQVGADTSSTNKISINIDAMSAKRLGINGLKVDGSDSTNADNAVNVIAEAIQRVSTQRSALGAVQNRLEHTIKNLDNIAENTTAAESAIRDTDMATEMVKYSNTNILAQAGQSMLAQANQGNQGVLSLL